MQYELRTLSTMDDKEIYHFLQELPAEENGFVNFAYGLTEKEFFKWLDKAKAMEKGQQLPKGWVPMSEYWFYVEGELVGTIRLRSKLTNALLENGGHIGYTISPRHRGHGYAKLMVEECLKKAAEKGIDRVLLTAQLDNIASCKTIEANDGRLWKEENGLAYYWISLGHDKLLPIESERLSFRLFEERDLEDFYAYAKEEGVGEMAGWPHHRSIEESKKILTSFLETKQDYAIIDKETNHVIGSFGIMSRYYEPAFLNTKQREIGYVLKKEYWGKGLMSEAITRMLDYLFHELAIDIVWCSHFLFNDRSQRVIEKAGFQFYKKGVYHAYLLQETYEDKQYILTKEQYDKQKETVQ